MTDSLYNRYRPQSFKEVIGHQAIVRSLKEVIRTQSNRTFLFTGPSGVGKTTLARIAAKECGCIDVLDHNAAKLNSVEDMRDIIDALQYVPFGLVNKAIVIDECHALSKAAWQSILKPLEEPPEWLRWFLCTTEHGKVPKTVLTRASCYDLRSVARDEIEDWLIGIAEQEKLELGASDEEQDSIISLCAKQAQGSPREALVNLGACLGVKNKEEARSLLTGLRKEEGAAIDLARALMEKPDWSRISDILNSLADENPESVRHVVREYMTTVILNGKAQEKHFAVLEAFSTPFAQTDGKSPLVLACGRLIFGG